MLRFRSVMPVKDRFDRAHAALPQAHVAAASAAADLVHQRAVQAARQAGHDPSVLTVAGPPEAPHVGLLKTPAGDQVADVEYGTVNTAPSPTLRQAITRAVPDAKQLYHAHLRQGVGL